MRGCPSTARAGTPIPRHRRSRSWGRPLAWPPPFDQGPARHGHPPLAPPAVRFRERIEAANARCAHDRRRVLESCPRPAAGPCGGKPMDERTEVRTDAAPRGTGAYSQAIRAGDFVFISGQGPLDPSTLEVVGTTVEEQTEATLRNLETIARAAGWPLGDIVKVSAFLSSIDLFAGFNATYERVFDTLPRPARTTTGAELRNILVEIDAVLYLPER